MKVLALLVSLVMAGCATTVPLTEHNRKLEELNAKVEEVRCPDPSPEEVAYMAKAEEVIPEFTLQLEAYAQHLAQAISDRANIEVEIRANEFSFVNNFKAVLVQLEFSDPQYMVTAYVTAYKVKGRWAFGQVVYTDKVLKAGVSPESTGGESL